MRDGALQATLEESDDVMALAFSPDGGLLATASADGSNAIWRLAPRAARLPEPGGDLVGDLVGGLVERRGDRGGRGRGDRHPRLEAVGRRRRPSAPRAITAS